MQEERDADRQKLQQLTSLIIGAKVIERAAKVSEHPLATFSS